MVAASKHTDSRSSRRFSASFSRVWRPDRQVVRDYSRSSRMTRTPRTKFAVASFDLIDEGDLRYLQRKHPRLGNQMTHVTAVHLDAFVASLLGDGS